MIKKFLISFTSLLVLTVIIAPSVLGDSYVTPNYINNKTLSAYCATEIPGTSGKSIAVYNPESGFMIYEKKINEKIYPASTVKIMTAIIAYERIPDKSIPITVSKTVVNQSTGLKLGIAENERYTAEDLIRAVLMCGSNDAANLLAEYVSGGNPGKFVAMMNDKATELGCTSTKYTNVTGLHDTNMYTTTSDLLKIAVYAYNLGDLSKWASAASYTFTPLDAPDKYKLRYNRNDFISRSNTPTYYYAGAYGLNSGFTPEAGNCLITAAQKQGMTYICVIMNSPAVENDDTNYAYADAKKLLDKFFDEYEIKNVIDTSSVVAEVPLNLSASNDHIALFPRESVSHVLPKNLNENDLSYEKIIYKEKYDAPVNKGEEFGELIVKYKDNYIIGRTKLICNESIERSPVLYIIEQIKNFVTSTFFIVTVITAIILFIIYAVVSVKSRKRQYWF